jgi:hypothetical protein
MEVSRVTSGVPLSVLPNILGTARWEAEAAAARGEGEDKRGGGVPVREGRREYRGLWRYFVYITETTLNLYCIISPFLPFCIHRAFSISNLCIRFQQNLWIVSDA